MMQTPVLCIVQARFNSTRLPGKMLLKLGDETLIERGHRIACEAFGEENVVVAIPASDKAGPLGDELRRIGARIFAFTGAEPDVLGRFHACAHAHRWHPDSIVHRWTPDDPFKTADACRRVVAGERLPVELGGEAFTLAQLDKADSTFSWGRPYTYSPDGCPTVREHITLGLFWNSPPPPAPEGIWTIDTQADYERAKAWVASQ